MGWLAGRKSIALGGSCREGQDPKGRKVTRYSPLLTETLRVEAYMYITELICAFVSMGVRSSSNVVGGWRTDGTTGEADVFT